MDRATPVWVIPEQPVNGSRIPTANNGTDKCTFVSPFLVAVQSKFRRKYYHKVVFAVLIVIILILLIAIIIVACKAHKSQNKCETKECLRIASSLLQTMDQTVDPCTDFYKFSCGNWAGEHPRPDSSTSYDWFSERQAKTIRDIRKFLQENTTESDPQAVQKAKIMYRACIDSDTLDDLGVTPILNYLKEFDLPAIPAMLNKTLQNSTIPYEFDWIRSIVKIKRILGMDVLIGFDIFPDPVNRSVNRVAIGSPESGSALPFNDDERYKRLKKERRKIIMTQLDSDDNNDDDDDDDDASPTIKAYVSYIRQVSAEILLSVDPNTKLDTVVESLDNAAVEAIRITKEVYKYNEEAENVTKNSENALDDFLNFNLTELQRQTDLSLSSKSQPIWEKYMKEVMNGTNSGFDPKTDEILTSKADMKYLQLVIEFLSQAQLKHIEYYIWWSIVEELAIHTTSAIRNLHYEYMRLIIKTEGSTSRSLYCTNGINNMMGMAVSYSLANTKFLQETRPKVDLMLSNIRQAFNNLVQGTTWMDKDTKLQTLDKSWSMKSLIGFPEWIMNKTRLDAFYRGVEVNTTTHLENMIRILEWRIAGKLRTLKQPNEFGWATTPSHVNAFHTFQANTITVPIAMLQYPFYELGLEALNYGAIGTILGHELTHGFDDNGRMFDKTGNMRQWWTNKTIEEYVNRTTCFIKQYNGFYIPEANDYVNGELTLGENIADNGGLSEAYYAYKIQEEQEGPEKFLPGLEHFTHDQLLFISFGNLWCESVTPTSMKYALEDSHCPGQIRLKGVLSNSPEFSKAFGCKKGSGMFPTDDRCKLW